jgi:hypothetical protein
MGMDKIIPFGLRIIGGWFLLLAIFISVIAIITFSSIGMFISAVSVPLLIMLPCSLYALTLYFTYDNNDFIINCCFFKKEIPIYTIMEVNYSYFGIFFFTLYREMLYKKYKIPIIFFCSKKGSRKRMEKFLEVLSKKNHSCIINV